jgi:hypothetical protein
MSQRSNERPHNALATLAAVVLSASTQSTAQVDAGPPNFAPSPDVGWVSYGPEFIPPANGPKPSLPTRRIPSLPMRSSIGPVSLK